MRGRHNPPGGRRALRGCEIVLVGSLGLLGECEMGYCLHMSRTECAQPSFS
jgi:hypothetical protein